LYSPNLNVEYKQTVGFTGFEIHIGLDKSGKNGNSSIYLQF
jgi:hypothetical protein